MYRFSDLSKQRMEGVSETLKAVMYEALKNSPVDFGIAWKGGKRDAEEQNELFQDGASLKDGYNQKSKHQEGKAIDVLPYVKGEYTTEEKYYYILIGVIMTTANHMEINIRNGGDWDKDGEYVTDHNFIDLPHFELI
ncbi:MAG: hypothetical protein KGY70_19085 [Bacteroidales bacterium]|nr:hypothetical protein [Bacteroidales bacterium]